MKAIRGKDSRAELAFRRVLFASGVRFRKHAKTLPGTPDVVVVRARLAVFIDGDFWHGNSWRLRGLPSLAAQFPNRTAYWIRKINRNIERDGTVTKELRRAGWRVIRFWESDVLADTDKCVRKVVRLVEKSANLSRS